MRTLLTLCLIMAAFSSFAQQYKISYTDLAEFSVDDPKMRIPDGYLQYEKTDNKMQLAYTAKLYKVRFGIKLTKYDEQMKVVKEMQLPGDRAYGPFDFTVKYVNGKLYVFYFQMAGENEEGDINLFEAEINTSDLSLGTPVKVLAVEQSNGGIFSKAFSAAMEAELDIKTSPDKSKILVFWTPNSETGNYWFKVYNADWSVVAEKKGTITTLTDPNVKSVCVDNAGNVFIAYKGDVDKKTMETHIIVCALKKKEKEVPLTLGDNILPSVCLFPSSKSNLIHIGGMYGDNENFLMQGCFYSTISAALPKPSKPELFPFADTLMQQFVDEGWGIDKKKAHGLKRLITPVPYELEDGSFGMANEFRDVIVDRAMNLNSNGVGGGMDTHTHILSGSIFNMHFVNGKCIASRIPKHRNSAGRTIGDSYSSVIYHNTIVFLYPDNEKNLSKPLNEVPVSSDVYTNSVLVAASIDANGNTKREKIIDKKDDDFLPVADEATMIPETNILYIPVQKIRKLGGVKREAMWAKVEIE